MAFKIPDGKNRCKNLELYYVIQEDDPSAVEFVADEDASNSQLNTNPSAPSQFQCLQCDKCFVNGDNLTMHVLTQHPAIWQCTECEESCSDEVSLLNHMTRHSEICQCSQCGKWFTDKSSLLSHMTLHSETPQCTDCELQFRNVASLKKHMTLHLTECTECGICFSTPCLLLKHMLVQHSGMRQCSQCQKLCKNQASLNSHVIALHPCTCPECGKQYRKVASLEKHMMQHLSKKQCEKCGKRFDHTDPMTLHTCVKPYKCCTCGKAFPAQFYLTTHLKCCHRSFACRKCDMVFAKLNILRKHMVVAHKTSSR